MDIIANSKPTISFISKTYTIGYILSKCVYSKKITNCNFRHNCDSNYCECVNIYSARITSLLNCDSNNYEL